MLTHWQAIEHAAKSGNGWRLPEVDEAGSIVGKSRLDDARCGSWTSTPVSGAEDRAWVVYFDYSVVDYDLRSLTNYVRLVRSAPASD
jgi:hypothetical protein